MELPSRAAAAAAAEGSDEDVRTNMRRERWSRVKVVEEGNSR